MLSDSKRKLLELRLRGENAPSRELMRRPDGPLPLSFAQQRLWFLDQLEPGSAEYNVPVSLRLAGVLDVAALGATLDAIMERHEVLRTRLVAGGDGVAHQVVDPPGGFGLAVVDLSGEPDPLERAGELVAADAVAPFDLARGPLFRGRLIRLGAEDHVLSLCMHHVVSDEWSAGVLRRELSALYAAFSRGERSPLEPLTVQYADFAAWQRDRIRGEALEGQLGYWRERLTGAAPLELPTDRPRPAVRSSAGATVEFAVSEEVAAGMRAVAREAGATMFMTLLSAFTVLLGTYAGQDDIVVGTPIGNRDRPETEDLIGVFLNTVVLRADLSGDPTFAELVGRVRGEALNAYANQDLPFEQLVEALQPERDRSRTPLFQVRFDYAQSGGDDELDLDGLAITGFGVAKGTSQFDLTVVLGDAASGLDGTIEFSTELFDAPTMERMGGHLSAVLEAVAAGPERRLSELPVLGEAERRRTLEEWNRTAAPQRAESGVDELIVARAAACPDATAVVSDGTSLSYGELEVRANRLAHHLRGLGVGPETVVALCLPRGVDMVVALLAVWKAGGAYLPLDPDYPAERLAYMVADSGAEVLLGHRALAGELAGNGVGVVWLDDPATAAVVAAAPSQALPVSSAGADRSAYVIYTSGSTGRPKGVLVSHRNLLNFLTSMGERPGLAAEDVLLAVTTLGFDIAGLELYLPLVRGARVVVADRTVARSPRLLATEIERHGVTVMQATPATWRMLVDDGWPGSPGLRAWCGGEALPQALADEILARTAGLWNLYGPTETTIWSSFHEVPAGAAPLLGRPIANTRMYVLDRHLLPVPAGVPGELFIGGAGVARGYGGRPELTAERFLADPFAGDGSRLYRTGDRVRWRANGELEFLGRVDQQVKIRGHRIEPGEIEAALVAHPAVTAAAVVARTDGGDARLVAYLVPADPSAGVPSTSELRALLRATLPDHMIPSTFTELSAFPLTPNGKLDRAALPTPEQPEPMTGMVMPRTPAEEVLAGIWAQVLGLERVGVTDNFFELGGHSLAAIQVISRVRAAFRSELPLAELFDRPTVRDLAAVADAAAQGEQAPPIVPVPRDRPLPLSFGQQRLWFLDQLEPGSAEYNIPVALRLTGPLDVAALSAALDAIVERHEVLRTRLVTVDGVAHQVVDPPAGFGLEIVDLGGEPDAPARVQALTAADAVTSFDLAAGPLFRGKLIRIGADEHVLSLVTHHVVSDDWSADVLNRELSVLYAAFSLGEPSPLAPPAVQYADFSVWQRDWLQGETLDGQLAYWRERLAGAPVLELPTDRPRPAVRSSAGAVLDFAVSPETAAGLRALSRETGATMFMTLVGGLSVVLSRYAGQDDVVVGTPIANRNRAETEDLIGFFVNTLALRTDLSGDPTLAEVIARVRGEALAAYAHQDLPFEQLVDAIQPERDRGRHPLFQVMITHGQGTVGTFDFAGLTSEGLDLPPLMAKFDLTVAFSESGTALQGEISYSTELFDRTTMERLAAHLVAVLDAAAADPHWRLSDVPIIGAGERHTVVAGWNDTATPLTGIGGVHEMVAAGAARRPGDLAMTFQDESLTYGELESRSNRLAHHLADLGVGPETVVGLRLDRGLDMVVAVLGVLKAGGAYLPLDPDYPAERISYMLSDSGAPLVLSHRGLAGDPAADDPASVVREVHLDDPATAARIQTAPEGAPDGVRHPDQLAYVIYTSGSTGRPKGVAVSHRSLANLVRAQSLDFQLTENDVSLQLTSFSFDVAGCELFAPLSVGARVVITGSETRRSARAIEDLVRAEAVSVAQMTPTIARTLDLDALPGLRLLVTGGETYPAELARVWGRGRRLVNAYGPTETTVCATLGVWGSEEAGPPPIGGPIANMRAYVLDRWLNPAPIGVPGELFLGGTGVARGYAGRPELTAERFLPDPFTADGSRLYRTGDRARWRPDGQLEFLGRFDDQVKVRGFRIEPGEVEAALVAHAGVTEAAVVARADGGEPRLVAYLVPADLTEGAPSTSELRTFLRGTLPDHFVPSVFVELTALPLSPNGKLDRAALPAPEAVRPDLAETFVAPRNATENVLTAVWAEVLGLDRVGATDNFFELGGDSIVSIQAVARARARGVHATPAQLFEHQTVAGLATVATRASAIDAEQGPVAGEFPLTPIQRWFFRRGLPEAGHFNQSILLEIDDRLDPGTLKVALEALVRHHDALRSRFTLRDGEWTGRGEAGEQAGPLSVVRLDGLDEAAEAAHLDEHALAAQTGLDLGRGPLIRSVLFDRGTRGQLLLLVAHHLVVDGVSWRILLEDLELAYGQAERGLPVEPAPKTTSFARWSERLLELARSSELATEAEYWLDATRGTSPLPRDHDGENTAASARTVRATVGAEQTARLLHEVPSAYRTQINDVLMTVLGLVVAEWNRGAGTLVDLEGHGREDLGPDVDVSRTVGWFTTFFPVALHGAVEGGDLGSALMRTKEHLRGIPRRGLGYGLLRYLAAGQVSAALEAAPKAELSFNYLGRFDNVLTGDARFRQADGSLGDERSSLGERTHLIEVNGEVVGGRLELAWTYSGQVHDEATVTRLAQRYVEVLGELIEHCLGDGAGGATPSDFPLAVLDQEALDVVLRERPARTVEDVYPLTALQQGMLFHTRLEPGTGVYWVQNGLLLEGELDESAFVRAWELVFARHPVLRSTVVSEGVPVPLSVVSRSVPIPLEVFDWSDLDEAAQDTALDEFMDRDRARGAEFDWSTLVRIALIRLADRRHQVVWGYHHLLLDGWSVPIVLGDLINAYHAYRTGEQPRHSTHRPFRDYLAWLAEQDLGAAEAYWTERLRGITAPTSLGVDRDTGRRGHDTCRARVSEEATSALTELGRRHHLTLNTVVQGAWALLLSAYSGQDDVVFGVTTSGRTEDLAGVESMVGLFINTTPTRVRVEGGRRIVDWLHLLQEEQVRARRFEHTPLVRVQSWSEVAQGQPIFDSLLLFENFPLGQLDDEMAESAAVDLSVDDNVSREQPNYPLTVIAGPGAELVIGLNYDRARFDDDTIERIAGRLVALLQAMAADPERHVEDLPMLPEDERRLVLTEWNRTSVPLPEAGGVHELVSARAQADPDAVALVFGERSLTYRELVVSTNRLAHHLRGAGVGAETVVGLCLERGLDMVVTMLAVLKAGGAYLPLDPEYPAERLAFMLSDTAAPVLVTRRRQSVELADLATASGGHVVYLDDPATIEEIASAPVSAPGTTTHPGRLAYVIYTSGSTGRPKGIGVCHRDIVS
ncbi:amino acid adenylation domain-containing protein, partial [Streptosporangium subroseum]|uniref:amino acid adenylation domain-containing protein n=1 Tax=Streptosporangium subroseum TaxID=106412 RepID=UPI00343423B8